VVFSAAAANYELILIAAAVIALTAENAEEKQKIICQSPSKAIQLLRYEYRIAQIFCVWLNTWTKYK
jgi:hypothetical protein